MISVRYFVSIYYMHRARGFEYVIYSLGIGVFRDNERESRLGPIQLHSRGGVSHLIYYCFIPLR